MASANKDTAKAQASPVQVDGDAMVEAQKILDEARAEALRIVEEAKAQAEQAKATQDPVSAPDIDGEEIVPIRLFKDGEKYKDDVFVAVNGQSFQIRRGETVNVPRKVADVLEQSMAQDAATASLIERESSAYASEVRSKGL